HSSLRSKSTRRTTNCWQSWCSLSVDARGRQCRTIMFGFLKERRREKLRAEPFPAAWRSILEEKFEKAQFIPATTASIASAAGADASHSSGDPLRQISQRHYTCRRAGSQHQVDLSRH